MSFYTDADGNEVEMDYTGDSTGGSDNTNNTTEYDYTGDSTGGSDNTTPTTPEKSTLDKVADWLKTPTGMALGVSGLAALLSSMGGGSSSSGSKGYQGGIPTLRANTTQIPGAITAALDRGNYGNVVPQGIAGVAQDPSKYHVKGAMGRSYFSPTTFSPVGASAPASAPAPATGTSGTGEKATTGETDVTTGEPIVRRAKGGPTTPRYLQGRTDGMADELDTNIDGEQPAKLSHGEFVIPADVVSHLGNGNSDAGADVLYKMMDKVRQARTGNPKQGKRINPEKFTPGGIAGYAGGGAVAFDAGGVTPAAKPAASGAPVTVESSLSPWAGSYVTDMLAKGQALTNQPYQAYTGQLTAGSSALQDQAFAGLGSLKTPDAMAQATKTAGEAATKMGNLSYTPAGVGTFDAAAAQQYMNPYLQASLDPQLAEARRQSQITQMANATKATQAGAFGGSRGMLMDAETQRSLGTNLAGITGKGYSDAFDKAQQQFNTEQTRQFESGKFGANYGLDALKGQVSAANTQGSLANQENTTNVSNIAAQMAGGTAQRGIESEALAAQQAAFEKERLNPYGQLSFQQSLLQGLPIGSSTATTDVSKYQDVMAKIGDILGLAKAVTPPK